MSKGRRQKQKNRLLNGLFMILLSSLVGCSPFKKNQNSLLLLLIEGLGEQDFFCSDRKSMENLPHLQELCPELVRFTHVFSPSIMTQTNISSLYSGKEPSVHGVIHNGPRALSGQFQTLAESALANSYRTSMISGGLPYLNNAGLSQGYEYYNDSYSGGGKSYFRPIQKRINIQWIIR